MPPAPSLLSRLQRLIEGSYDWQTGIQDLAPFIVGDEGYGRLYGEREILEEHPDTRPGPRTLVSWKDLRVRVRLYYPDRLVRHLEERNPLHRLDDSNVESFSLLVEELDHLLMVAWCSQHHRKVRLLELEFHANLTKYFVLTHFLGRLSRRARLSASQRFWIRDRLFGDAGDGLHPRFRHRYRTAARLALRLIVYLEELRPAERIRALRRFTRCSWGMQRTSLEAPDEGEKLRLLLAA